MAMVITSAGCVLSLLDEKETEVQIFALQRLNQIVDMFWPEISEVVDKIEVLYEDQKFSKRDLAALVASKVYYHLGAYEESLTFALGAGDFFNVNEASEYVETIISKCIDHYTKLQKHNNDEPDNPQTIDPRLKAVVDRMFERCFDDKMFKQAVGIAIETYRLDVLENAIMSSDNPSDMLSYTLKVCMTLVQSRALRNTLLRNLVRLYMSLPQPDFISVCQCLIFLDDADAVADILISNMKKSESEELMGYQIGFDLYESGTQQFLTRVQTAVRRAAPRPLTEQGSSPQQDAKPTQPGMETDEPPATTEETPATPELSDEQSALQGRLEKLVEILTGEQTIQLHLQFLIRNNKADQLIIKQTKDAVRNSVCHSATVISSALMHSGTTSDAFLRDNLEWLGKATNWAKFTATASLGVIHRGHEKDALNLMSAYLPKDSSPSSAYSEGGGLYALGLIHANHGASVTEYLLNQLKEASSEIVRHGGCLGLGLAAMGSARQDVYDQLQDKLFQDDAVTGEAAGIAMGLVMLGTKSPEALQHMLTYAQETQHEKILRGLALGIALVMFARREEAEPLIEQLSRDKDPILRWCGMYTIAMAYCGTAHNPAVKRLLHVAVSDTSDDVRRAAVISLGFLLFRNPEQMPSVVSLLAESYNPHVRYGAAMALGIACAGTGVKEAIGLLDTMVNDPVNYVRQGALIASSFVLIQQNEVTCPKVTQFRQLYAKVIADKHEDVIAKFGAILAQGIIDGGGRNVTISLQSSTGHVNMRAAVGLLVFNSFWYWFPLAHFLSLAFVPTCVVALNKQLQMPKITFRSGAKPSTFAYPPPLEEKKDKAKEKVETAVLSTTAKQKKKDEKKKADKMQVDEEPDKKPDTDVKMEEASKEKEGDKEKSKESKEEEKKGDKKEEEKKGEKKEEEKKKPEPNFELLSNPARAMRAQLRVLSLVDGCRYRAIKPVSHGGILLLSDTKPDEEEQIIQHVQAGGPKVESDTEEPAPPEPFEWTED